MVIYQKYNFVINMSKKGINIIVPTYKAEKYIINLLNSLKNQTIDYNLFEAILL